MDKPVAVIILNWNGEKMLSRFLPEVVKTTDPGIADIIVADNGSTDNSLQLLARDFPEVKTVRLEQNYGFAEGYNRAIAMTRYRYTVLLNSDVATTSGWLNTLYEYMETHPATGAVQPKIRAVEQPDCFEYAGASGGFLDCNGYPYCRGRIFDTIETDKGQYNDVAEIFWASGAALMVRTELYQQAGGLDADFFAHMEEIDLCWRIKLAGYKIEVVPQSVVHHLGGGTLPASNPRKTYLNFRNNLLLLHKNLPDSCRRRRLFIRRLYDTAAWGKFVASLDFKNASAVLRAHRDFRKMAYAYKTHPAVNLLPSRPNILFSYFLRRITTYSSLSRSK